MNKKITKTKYVSCILIVLLLVNISTVSYSGIKFGTISVVKDKITQLKEKRIQEYETTSGADGIAS